MISKLSCFLADEWVKAGNVTADDRDSYRYGLELFFSTIVNFIMTIIISFVIHLPGAFIAYSLSFIPLRMFAGGFHANGHWKCILFSSILFVVISELFYLLSFFSYLDIVVSIVSFVFLGKLAPIAAENKPLTDKEFEKSRKVVLLLGSINCILAILSIGISVGDNCYVQVYYGGEVAVVVGLVIAKLGDFFSKKNAKC